MDRVEVSSRVSPDGVLHLDVPMGLAMADQEVRVTVEPVVIAPVDTRAKEDWSAFIRQTAGAWHGDFERPAMGLLEERDVLP